MVEDHEDRAPVEEAAVAGSEPPDAPDLFATPLPTEACPEANVVAIAHRDATGLPAALERAVAFRSEDGRRLRIVIANHALELDAAGRFPRPAAGEARFEMDARRTRRGPLEPRVLGAPDSRRGGLSHTRLVTPDAFLTFGNHEIGRVELTEITPDHVCGRVELDDGFTRVRGAFSARVVGDFPE